MKRDSWITPALCLVLLLSGQVLAQETGEPVSVAVKTGAVLRSESNIQSKNLDTVPFGTSLRILGAPDAPVEVMNVTGNWVNVEYKGKTGWIFAPLLKRPGENHIVRIMNGTIVRDDPAAPIPATLQTLMNATKSGEANLDIRPTAPDAMRQCEGQLVLLRGGKLKPGKNTFSCGGVSGQSRYEVSEWHVISGKLYFTAKKSSTEICHSERCTETTYTEKTTRPFSDVTANSGKDFAVAF